MKYMGSKARISKELAPMFNDIIKKHNIKTYIEPFVGGANMIDKIECETKIGIDNNYYLISMWKALQSGWEPPLHITEEEYYHVRDNKDKYPPYYVALVGFCASFGAKWFGGYARSNKPDGTPRNMSNEAIRNILKQLPNVMDVEFICDDYRNLKDVKNALIYCDPPYANTTKYKNDFNHDEFWNWVRKISKNNIVLVSEYNAPNDFDCIWSKEVKTLISSQVDKRKKDVERLFIYKYGKQI